MDRGVVGAFEAAIDVLADLSQPSAKPRPSLSIPLERFRWVPPCEELFAPGALATSTATEVMERLMGLSGDVPAVAIERGFAERLAAVDQVRAATRSVRVGWLFVAGSFTEAGRVQQVFHPLVRIPVRVVRPPLTGGAYVVAAGDVELSPLISGDERTRLEAGIEFDGGALQGVPGVTVSTKLLARLPKLQRFARAAAEAAGLAADRVVPVHGSPDDLMRVPGLTVVAGYGVYVAQDTTDVSRATTLRQWIGAGERASTAFHAVYGLGSPTSDDNTGTTAVEGPLVLSPSQREAVRRSRSEPVTVVAGPPGTGKSHTIAAIACDALARGGRVLVAARSEATVDALIELLERTPGPDPVVFGSSERRAALAARLAAGQQAPVQRQAVEEAASRRDCAIAERDAVRAHIVDRLRAEMAWTRARELHQDAWSVAPGLLEPDVDLPRVRKLLVDAARGDGGWWRRRRRRRARAELVALSRADPSASVEAIADVAQVAEARAAARSLDSVGGLELTTDWARLEPLDAVARSATGEWLALDARSVHRINPTTLGAIGALATALRSGRAARRDQLVRLDTDALTTALPLWIGTLDDIDDLLPARPASFDLVLLDEASSIDQPSAAAALLRGRRAVIAGDPRQLRHVSFVGDDAINASITRHGLDGTAIAARLDVRRNSIFDTAASVAPVTILDEHYRSDPHLVDFVTRRLYDGAITVATHSPLTDYRDCVDAVRVDERTEVDTVLDVLRGAHDRGARSVGVVTPFRAQADALEEAILDSFSADELERMDLRVGTVHAFQGIERDLVLCSLGIHADSEPATWRFAQDPHLLAVFLTRARRQLIFIYSTDPPPDGLLAEYLAGKDVPPGPRPSAGQPGPWCQRVTDELTGAGLRLAVGYPTGRQVIDAVILDAAAPSAVITGVHRDGPDAHIERHLELRRRGWHIEEVFPSRWSEQLALLAIRLRNDLIPGRTG